MTLTLDPSTPTAVYAASGNAQSASFVAPANTVIVVLATMQATAPGGSANPSVLDSGSLSWLPLGRLPATGSTGEVIAWASIPKTTVSRTVTVTGVSDNTRAKYLQPLVFNGADLASTFPTVVTGAAAGSTWGGSTNVNDTSAYPNSVIMPVALAIPTGAVRIPLGSNIATAANNNPNGTVFVLDAGTYSGGYEVIPHPGQQFYGQGAGHTILSNIQIHRGSSATTNIGIFNLTLRDVGPNTNQRGAIDACFSQSQPASGWHVANCEITNNYIGMQLGPNSLIENNTFHHNGGKAIGDGEDGSIIRYNQFFFNLTPGQNNYYDSGADDSGIKMALMTGAQIYGNLFHKANGNNGSYGGIGGCGIWMDVSCGINLSDRTGNYPASGNVYDSNIIYSNYGSGLCDETGGNNKFTNNLIVGNANGGGLDGFRRGGLVIQSSNRDTAQNNYIWGNPNSVFVYLDQTGGDRADQNRSKNNSIINNTMDLAPTQGTGQWNGSSGNTTISGNTIVPGFSGVTVPKLKAGPQSGGTVTSALMSAAITASRTGSQMWAIYADAAGGAAPTPGSGVTRYSAAVGAITGAALRQTAAGVISTPMQITTTAPTGPLSWLAFEIVPAVGGGTTSSGTISSTGTIGARGSKKVTGSGRVIGTGSITTPATGSGAITIDTVSMPARVSTAYLAGGDVTTTPFFARAGTVLVALAGFTSWPGGGSVIPSISDSSGLTWTQQALDPSGARQDQSGVWTAVVPSDRTLTVSTGAVHNVSMKSLQVVPMLGVDTTSPVSSAGIGSSTSAPTATATASAAGARMLAHFTDYWGVGLPTFGPGTEISATIVGTTFAAGVSAAAPSAGAAMSIGITAPTTGVSWTYAWVALKPAAGTPFSLISAIGTIAAAGTKTAIGAGTIVDSGTILGRPFTGGQILAVARNDLSRVDLTVTWSGESVTNVDVVRTDATGTAVPVRAGTNAVLTSGQWIGADHEAPFDQVLRYQVTPHQGGSSVTSQAVTLASAGAYWLKSPGRPTLNVQVFPAEDHATTMTRGLPQGVFQILGREDPIVRSMRRFKPTTILKFLTATDADREALRTLLDDGQTLLYQAPATDSAGSDTGYVAVGSYDFARIGYTLSARLATLNVTYTGRPSGLASPVGPGSTTGGGDSGGGTFGGVWADVISHYQSWADVEIAKGSWADLETNIAAASAPGTL